MKPHPLERPLTIAGGIACLVLMVLSLSGCATSLQAEADWQPLISVELIAATMANEQAQSVQINPPVFNPAKFSIDPPFVDLPLPMISDLKLLAYSEPPAEAPPSPSDRPSVQVEMHEHEPMEMHGESHMSRSRARPGLIQWFLSPRARAEVARSRSRSRSREMHAGGMHEMQGPNRTRTRTRERTRERVTAPRARGLFRCASGVGT